MELPCPFVKIGSGSSYLGYSNGKEALGPLSKAAPQTASSDDTTICGLPQPRMAVVFELTSQESVFRCQTSVLIHKLKLVLCPQFAHSLSFVVASKLRSQRFGGCYVPLLCAQMRRQLAKSTWKMDCSRVSWWACWFNCQFNSASHLGC